MNRVVPYTVSLVVPTFLTADGDGMTPYSGDHYTGSNIPGTCPATPVWRDSGLTAAPLATKCPDAIRSQSPLVGQGGLPDALYPNFNAFKQDYKNFKATNGDGTLLILTRHTESLFNRVSDFTNGDNDSPLIADGVSQASEDIATLTGFPLNSIISSPLARALDMAQQINKGLGLTTPVIVDSNLSEMERGVLSARPKKMTSVELDTLFVKFDDVGFRATFLKKYSLTEAEMDHVFTLCRERRKILQAMATDVGLTEDEFVARVTTCENTMDCAPPGGGESFRHAEARTKDDIAATINYLPSGNFALVGHGMMNRFLMLELLGIPIASQDQLYSIGQGYGSITVLWRKKDEDKWALLVFNSGRDGK